MNSSSRLRKLALATGIVAALLTVGSFSCGSAGTGGVGGSGGGVGGTGGGSASDAGIRDGGSATINGTLGFTPVAVRSFARLLNTQPDYGTMWVAMFDKEVTCVQILSSGPFASGIHFLEMGAFTDAGLAKGSFTPDGTLTLVSPALEFDTPGENSQFLAGTFNFDWNGPVPIDGVFGSFNLRAKDGGTVSGSFRASYCGAY